MQDLTIITTGDQYGDDLADVGALADAYARQDVFATYQARRPANTRRRQQADLRLFAGYLASADVVREAEALYGDPQAWRGMSAGLVVGFVKWQLQRGYAIGSINVRLSTVKMYCRLAARAAALPLADYQAIRLVEGFHHTDGRNIDRDREVTRIGAKKAEPTLLNAGHRAKLKAQPNTKRGHRDRMLLCLLLDLGLRCSEAAALRVRDIDLAAETITFYREKVGKTQTHRLRGDVLDAAIAYLPDVAGREYLFPGYKGQPLGVRSINARVGTLALCLPEEYRLALLSPHDLRHDWATVAARHKTDPKSLQQAGGWSSPAMPLRYVADAEIANEGVKLG